MIYFVHLTGNYIKKATVSFSIPQFAADVFTYFELKQKHFWNDTNPMFSKDRPEKCGTGMTAIFSVYAASLPFSSVQILPVFR